MSETRGEMIGQAMGRLGGVLIVMEGRLSALETPSVVEADGSGYTT